MAVCARIQVFYSDDTGKDATRYHGLVSVYCEDPKFLEAYPFSIFRRFDGRPCLSVDRSKYPCFRITGTLHEDDLFGMPAQDLLFQFFFLEMVLQALEALEESKIRADVHAANRRWARKILRSTHPVNQQAGSRVLESVGDWPFPRGDVHRIIPMDQEAAQLLLLAAHFS